MFKHSKECRWKYLLFHNSCFPTLLHGLINQIELKKKKKCAHAHTHKQQETKHNTKNTNPRQQLRNLRQSSMNTISCLHLGEEGSESSMGRRWIWKKHGLSPSNQQQHCLHNAKARTPGSWRSFHYAVRIMDKRINGSSCETIPQPTKQHFNNQLLISKGSPENSVNTTKDTARGTWLADGKYCLESK